MNVRSFKTVLTVLLLANWFACTAHCELKKSQSPQNPAGHGNAHFQGASNSADADDSQICDWVASGGYKNSESNVVVPEFVLAFVPTFWKVALDEQLLTLKAGCQSESSTAPPELVPTVPFASRTALPARAPSIAS